MLLTERIHDPWFLNVGPGLLPPVHDPAVPPADELGMTKRIVGVLVGPIRSDILVWRGGVLGVRSPGVVRCTESAISVHHREIRRGVCDHTLHGQLLLVSSIVLKEKNVDRFAYRFDDQSKVTVVSEVRGEYETEEKKMEIVGHSNSSGRFAGLQRS